MERLWAPWRMVYIRSVDEEDGCLFCRKVEEAPSEANLVLHRGKHTLTLMNLYPYNSGHLMVAPRLHVADLEALPEEVVLALMKETQRAIRILKAEMHPHGFNVGLNLGRVAGAGVDKHLHLHIVPRWSGDSNFMPVIGDVKVIPEALAETYRRLRPHFEATGDA
jgi:Diadenosine tetraphosphate (Ap4A) hydrolase and other HIT family hydrolases